MTSLQVQPEWMGLGVDRTVRRRGEEGGRPFVLFLHVANVYANIAKTVRWAQLLKDLDVSATEKGKVRILALALEPGKSMDHVGMGTWRLINDWAGRPTGLVFSTEKGREGWSLRMSDQPVCVIPRTPIFFFFQVFFQPIWATSNVKTGVLSLHEREELLSHLTMVHG